MSIFKKLFSKRKNKNQEDLAQQNVTENLNGNFFDQSNQNVSELSTTAVNDELFLSKNDFNASSQNIDYELVAKQQYENSKYNPNNNDTYTDLNSISYYDSSNFPFENKYTERTGDIFYKDRNDSRLKKDVDFKAAVEYINSDKTDSIFKTDKLYTLNELKIYKIPLTKTVKVFDNGLVFFKIKDSIELTPQEANVYVFKNPYDIENIPINFDSNINLFNNSTQNSDSYNDNLDEFSNFSFNPSNPKLLYRIANISFQNQNGALNNITFDIFGSEIIAILSSDNLSNYLLGSILKGIYKSSQGSIYFNESILSDSYQTKLVNLSNNSYNQFFKANMLKYLSQINYLGVCSINQNSKVSEAFEKICGYFGIQLDRNLFGNLLQLTNFLKFVQIDVKDLKGTDLDKFNAINDLLLGRKVIFVESLIIDLDDLSKQNLLTFLHNYMMTFSTACLLITNDVHDASIFADRFLVIKGSKIYANFTKWDIPENDSVENYLINVVYNNQNS